MPDKILAVDDDPAVLRLVKRFLSGTGSAPLTCDSGSEALLLARETQPDLILLDAELPDLDGCDVVRALKKDAQTRSIPVIMMSGRRTSDGDMIGGFSGGADDYVVKPLQLSVLLARIKAVLRRGRLASEPPDKLSRHGVELDLTGRTARVHGAPVKLTRKEFDLLAALMSKPGRVLAVGYLLQWVWGADLADYNDHRTVEVHVYHLRKKLGPKASSRIVNVIGHGYKFDDEPAPGEKR